VSKQVPGQLSDPEALMTAIRVHQEAEWRYQEARDRRDLARTDLVARLKEFGVVGFSL